VAPIRREICSGSRFRRRAQRTGSNSSPFRLQLFCMPDWKNKLFFGDNLGLLNSRGAPGHAPIPSKRATHWHHPAFPCSIPRTCIESNPAPIIQIRRGRRSRRIADPQHGRSQLRWGALGHPIPKSCSSSPSCIRCRIPGACLDSSPRIAGASHPDATAGQDAGKVRSAILGPGPTSHSSASILYFCAASQGACDFQADSRIVY